MVVVGRPTIYGVDGVRLRGRHRASGQPDRARPTPRAELG
jgi:hypothetical protein